METTQPPSPTSSPSTLSDAQVLDLLDRACLDDGFPAFVEGIFSKSTDIMKDGRWTGGAFVQRIAAWLGGQRKTIRVSAKDHFKSFGFYAHIMWKIYRMFFLNKSREINYFSYSESMAAYHIAKIKQAVKCNPLFAGLIDLKPQAAGVIAYTWDGKHVLKVFPRGLLEFKRGIHCDDVYVDDPFQDPDNKLEPTKIVRINDIMKTQILDMFQRELHISGTAQTNHDFFFDDEFCSRFSRLILPALTGDEAAGYAALWPEWMDVDELLAKKKERGEKVFNQEYLCSPAYAEDAFFSAERMKAMTDPDGVNHNARTWAVFVEGLKAQDRDADIDVVGGWDLAKRNHPAHFCLFAKIGGVRRQIHDKWFDRVDYKDQLAYITDALEWSGAYRCWYDSTRGELDLLEESGDLPGEFEGVSFTFKGKRSMAEAFDRAATGGKIKLLPIQRTLRQIGAVNNDLHAVATPEGHGDSFWSVAMTFRDEAESVGVRVVGEEPDAEDGDDEDDDD